MSKTSKRKSGEDRKSRSSSVGSREKRLSVFDRLGTKAPAVDQLSLPPCRHNLHHGSCPHCSLKLSPHTLVNSLKRGSKKEVDLRQGEEGSCSRKESPEGVDWSHWDQSDLEYEDEKALERRRQLLQRELELQMKNDSRNYPTNSKKRSSSSSSTSSSESSTVAGGIGSSSSSISSGLPPISQLQPELKKLNASNLDLTSIKKTILSKMVYKERSPGGKSSSASKRGISHSSRKGASSSSYKRKSISPSPHPSLSSRKQSPHKQRLLSSRRKETESRGRSRQRSVSRERRRDRSKEVASSSRHRQRSPRSQHSSSQRRSSDRKKEDDRLRREDSRRDRRTDSRDSRRDHHEEVRSREKAREKERLEAFERCRERQRDREVTRERRDKGRQPRSQQRREKDRYARSQESKHCQLSPPSHHHYRERSRYSSSERERVALYKELSPREPDSRIRVSQGSEASRMRRRGAAGWEGGGGSSGRYESSSSHKSSSSRDWVDPGHSSTERTHRDWERVVINDWPSRSQRDTLLQEERRSKHSQDKDYSTTEKDKDIEWKRERVRESEEAIHSGSKRQRVEESSLPPPPICEELSDISDDPDDILNRDDIEECGTEERGSDDLLKEEESLHPMSTSSSAIEHGLLHQRIGDEEGIDSLVFEEISDEELEEDSKNKGGDALGVDWASLIAECRSIKKPVKEQSPSSAKKMWDSNNIFRRIGVSKKYAGEQLYQSIQQKLTADGGEGLLSEIGGIEGALSDRKKHHLLMDTSKKALSARLDLAIRRELCGLPLMAINTGPFCHFQVV